jgi:aryl-alcohol dehydrogenase-like predicted oxidoreductase
MQLRQLGSSDLMVSPLCLGTMTWGTQTDPADAHRQIDMALDHGINFTDTAELYPVTPVSAGTYGRSEEILGDWLARPGNRARMVVATKVAGGGRPHIRGGQRLDAAGLGAALDASLKRLRTDVIDLYQVHWPDRPHYHFRQSWTFSPGPSAGAEARRQITEILGALGRAVAAGKVRHIGVSNETAWGVMTWLSLAGQHGLPRITSIQNEWSLLHRLFDTDLAEIAVAERVPLLAYSPLAGGLLTGKYQSGAVPAGSRLSINPGLSGRATPRAFAAIEEYQALARRHGMTLPQLAIAFAMTRAFMAAPILGATSADQLAEVLPAASLSLNPGILTEIGEIHRRYPIPM